MHENFREYLDQRLANGFSVRHDEHLSDPDLIDPGGNPVETWRENYPTTSGSTATSTRRRSTSSRSSC